MIFENTAEEISFKTSPGQRILWATQGPKQTEVRGNVYGDKIKISK